MPAKKKKKSKPAPSRPRHAAKKKVRHGPKPTRKPARKSSGKPAPRASGRAVTHRVQAPRVTLPPSEAETFAVESARLLHDDKCTDITVLDVRGHNPMTDFLVIGSGTSDRQMRSVLQHVEELGEKSGYRAVRSSSDDRATWLLADFMNVIVHLFEPNTRAHYDIEMMWGDARRVDWERPGTTSRDRAGLNSSESAA